MQALCRLDFNMNVSRAKPEMLIYKEVCRCNKNCCYIVQKRARARQRLTEVCACAAGVAVAWQVKVLVLQALIFVTASPAAHCEWVML